MAESNLGPQWRHLAVVLRGEKAITTGARKALAELLAYTQRALASGGYDPTQLSAAASGWPASVGKHIDPAVAKVFLGSFDAAARGVIDPAPYSVTHLGTVRNRLVGVPDEVFHTMRGELEAGRQAGEGIAQLAARVDVLLSDEQRWTNRAVTIARTETIGAANAGGHASARASAELLGEDPAYVVKEWMATSDGRTRETHLEVDGFQVVGLDTPFTVGDSDLQYAADPDGDAGEVVNCVVGSTQVEWPGQDVHAVTRRLYTGEFIELRTARNHVLTVTPNHPVLTPQGYVAAQHLRPGQHVLATDRPPAPEVEDGPPSIEQVQRAALQVGQARGVTGRAVDFHGDGTDAKVQVVRPDRNLSLVGDAQLIREPAERVLVRLGAAPGSRLARGRGNGRRTAGDRGWSPWGRAASSLLGGGGQRTPLLGAETTHPQTVGLAAAADLQTQGRQATDDQRAADTEVARHLQDALAFGMTPCEVVGVERYVGTHDVFNLQTSDAWYVAAGVANHNCRCTTLYLYPGDPDYPDEFAPDAEVLAMDAASDAPYTTGPADVVDPGPQTAAEHAARTMTPEELAMETKTRGGMPQRAAKQELARRGLTAAGEDEETRTGVVVVALPAATDPVHGIGLEDKHCTLVFLGDTTEMAEGLPTRDDIVAAIDAWLVGEVAGRGPFSPFPEKVTGVESLGDDGARVWMLVSDDGVTSIHDGLLTSEPIAQLVAATEQFPTYTPHVTIGYPVTAEADADGQTPGEELSPDGVLLDKATETAAAAVESITFDRIALWWAGEATEWVLTEVAATEPPAETPPTQDQVAAALDTLARFTAASQGRAYADVPLPEDQPAPEGTPAVAQDIPADGDPFHGILWPEATLSGDGRMIEAQATVWRDLPLPLMAQDAQMPGHDGAVRVGRIDTIERDTTTYAVPVLRYTGVWDTSPAAVETARQVGAGVARGVSVDGDDLTVELRGSDGQPLDPMVDDFPEDGVVVESATAARVAGATVCSIPAFQQAYVANGVFVAGEREPGWNSDGTPLTSGQVPEGSEPVPGDAEDPQVVMASAWSLVASAGPVWAVTDFANPGLDAPTRLTVTDDGRVYGHLATWGVCHIGIDGVCQEPPVSATNYAYFATGAVQTDAGLASVGTLTMDTGHAPMPARFRAAAAHYDNTGSAVADVAMGQDAVGIWFSGRLRPGTTPEQVYAMRAAGSVSGDWREVGGQLELVAALVVNVPGFPIPSASVAASGARPVAMVASGVVTPKAAQVSTRQTQDADLAAAVETVLAARDRHARAVTASARLRVSRAVQAASRLSAHAAQARRTRAMRAAERIGKP